MRKTVKGKSMTLKLLAAGAADSAHSYGSADFSRSSRAAATAAEEGGESMIKSALDAMRADRRPSNRLRKVRMRLTRPGIFLNSGDVPVPGWP
jgi:hypothetical protein